MNLHYKLLTNKELHKSSTEYSSCYEDYDLHLVRFEEDKEPVYIMNDGCEPEDANFYRHYSTLVDELNSLAARLNEHLKHIK